MRNLAAPPAGDQKRGGISAPVVSTCSHPIAPLQRFHRITQKRHVRVTQFISLSSSFICSRRCAAGRSLGGGAFVTSEERSGFIPSGLSTTLRRRRRARACSRGAFVREFVSAPALVFELRNAE